MESFSEQRDLIHLLTEYSKSSPEAVTELIRLYKDAKPDRRLLILNTFDAVGRSKTALPLIEEALKSENKAIKEA